jgi:hypothetical protein
VIEDRPYRPTADAAPPALPRRVRGWLGLSVEPPLPRPRAVRVEPVRRAWLAAFWQARVSVRAGVPLDDYLRSRLARYLSSLPVARTRLPLTIDVDDGQLVVQPGGQDPRSAAAPTNDPDAWLAALVASDGPGARQEVSELEVRLAVLDGEADAARRRIDDVSRRLAADVASGIIAAPGDVEATAEQMGRPPVRSAAPHVSLVGFAAAAIAAETWQIAAPLLRSAGIDPGHLGQDAAQRPVEATAAAVFALGVSVGLFALAHSALEAGLDAVRGGANVARRSWLGAAGAGAALLAALVAAALAALPAPSTALPPATLGILLLAVPLATALLLRRARIETAGRTEEITAALAWDRERTRALADRARRLEELAWCEDEEREIERKREAARRRLREISARAVAATRLATEAERRERAALARLAQSLVGALELDRYEFVRQASARGAAELLAPRRRKGAVAEPRPTPSRAEVPAAGAAPGPVTAEPGRLAS